MRRTHAIYPAESSDVAGFVKERVKTIDLCLLYIDMARRAEQRPLKI